MEAKPGDRITAKAAAKLRRLSRIDIKENATVAPKSASIGGQWFCIDCGDLPQNNMQAHGHPKSHRLAWLTEGRIEAP